MTGSGALHTYLGTALGVGKTYAMLSEGQRRAESGERVVIGWVEQHGRPDSGTRIDVVTDVVRQQPAPNTRPTWDSGDLQHVGKYPCLLSGVASVTRLPAQSTEELAVTSDAIGEKGQAIRDAEAVALPELHLADWRATKDTLHLYCQIVGKVKLATTPPRNHWWNVPLYVDVRGLTTRRLHHRHTTFEITFDFVDHALVVRTADGRTKSFSLGDGFSVADFDARIHQVLGELGVDVEIKEEPFGLPITTPFAEDVQHAAWDPDALRRFGRILDWSDSVFEEFSGWFNGKISPVHLFWHSFDLAVTRFSGRQAPPLDADPVTREAYTHEVISFGFWPGDDQVDDAAYYSYTAPEPPGLRNQSLSAGTWIPSGSGSLAILPYETVRTARDPRTTLLAFCQSAYEAGARLAGWDTTSFTSTWCPMPEQLQQLRATTAADLGRPKTDP